MNGPFITTADPCPQCSHRQWEKAYPVYLLDPNRASHVHSYQVIKCTNCDARWISGMEPQLLAVKE